MSNTQLPSGVALDSAHLVVHSVFPTIQGEGPFAGRAATFVRLYGCNIQCPWCDTDYTSTAQVYDNTPSGLAPLIEQVAKLRPLAGPYNIGERHLVVITGGEPFRQPLGPVVEELMFSGFDVQIETNGTLYQELPLGVHVVCSPKTPKINPELIPDAFKYVLDHEHVDPADGLPASTMGWERRLARPPSGWAGPVYVQPLDEKNPERNAKNLEACVKSVLRFGYRLSVQTHKIANIA